MNRRRDSKRRFLALAAGLAALLVAAPPAAQAAPTAQDEYTLSLPGYGDNLSGGEVLRDSDVAETPPQLGVAGEAEESTSPLSSLVDAAGDGTVLLLIVFFLVLGLAGAPFIRNRLLPPSPR